VKSTVCARIEPDLAAVAASEADGATAQRVSDHVAGCGVCRGRLDAYRRVERETAALQKRSPETSLVEAARGRLEEGFADLKRRIARYAVFSSPLGDVLVARSEIGVVWVEYLSGHHSNVASLLEKRGLEAIEDPAALAAIGENLGVYLAGRERRLGWPIDLRLVRTPFQRAVLEATAAVPYGAVVSYKRIAQEIGRPEAVRAVAQALRHNPVALAIPCHRVVGSEGDLVGYAGGKTTLKEKLLTIEGVPVTHKHKDQRVESHSMYLLAPKDSEYCLPSCPSIVKWAPGIPMMFGSRDGAEAAGYRPCTTCRPDLHPLGEAT
jgi:O-6-methylguanine DNA methyltransferase